MACKQKRKSRGEHSGGAAEGAEEGERVEAKEEVEVEGRVKKTMVLGKR